MRKQKQKTATSLDKISFCFVVRGKADNLDEQEVNRGCLEGDRQAFEKIVERYRDKVYWTAFNLVLDSEDARDVAQQSFIKVWKSLPEYDSGKTFSGWITKSAANRAIDFLRARHESEPLEDIIPAEKFHHRGKVLNDSNESAVHGIDGV